MCVHGWGFTMNHPLHDFINNFIQKEIYLIILKEGGSLIKAERYLRNSNFCSLSYGQ